MKNFPVKVDDEVHWISRSIASAGFIFTDDDGLRVLACKRGKLAPDYQMFWNCPCGYLDYDETIKQCCIREIAEETNLIVSENGLILEDINDNPNDSNKQNVTFKYWSFNHTYGFQTVYAKGFELEEVADVEWIKVSEIGDYMWAFNHDKIIAKIALKYLTDYLSFEEMKYLKKYV